MFDLYAYSHIYLYSWGCLNVSWEKGFWVEKVLRRLVVIFNFPKWVLWVMHLIGSGLEWCGGGGGGDTL